MPPFPTAIPLTLYLHIPWCVRKCPYCDFNSHRAPEALPETAYVDALLRDLEQDLPRAGSRIIDSIFIGGGTPSLFSPDAIERLLLEVGARLRLRPDLEVTLEANPGTVEQGKFRDFRAAGINRLSIGIQSFNEEHLRRLGRIHDGREARRAVEAARAAGFENVNLDLMFGLPQQSVAQALADIETAIALAPAHISHYQLTLEPNTLFYKYPPPLPDEDRLWEMQERCQERLARNGYTQYEISAYARPGRRCRHNLNYWRFGDYLGIGAGAHGKLTELEGAVVRLCKLKNPRAYLEHAGSIQGIGERRRVTAQDLVLEFMLNALRLSEGVPVEWLGERTGLAWQALEPLLSRAKARDLLAWDGGRLRSTELGRRFLNDLLELFLPENAAVQENASE